MTDDRNTNKPEDWVEIEVTSEGISATAYHEVPVVTDCKECGGDDEDCEHCYHGHVTGHDPHVSDEWWVPWTEVIKDEASWSAFQEVAIEHTGGTLELET